MSCLHFEFYKLLHREGWIMQAHEGMTKKDFNKLLALAKKGDVKAECEIGLAFRNGWGTKADGEKAFEWVQKAVAHGDAQAMCTLGHMVFIGDGGVRDYEKARIWCSSSVAMGYPQCAVVVNELAIAEAIDEGNLEEVQKQF